MIWTTEQVLALASDSKVAKAAEPLATPQRWLLLGKNKKVIWGQVTGSSQYPYQTQIEITQPTFKCSCPSRKSPCKHVIGLFLNAIRQPESFNEALPPTWVSTWLNAQDRRRAAANKREAKHHIKDTVAQARRAAERQIKVETGLKEFRLWLADLAENGLITGHGKPRSFWEAPATRLVDAQAPGLAERLQRIADIPYTDETWQDQVLEQIGLLALIDNGYQRLNTLPDPLKKDIRALIGWPQRKEEVLANEGVFDHWAVLGQRIVEINRLRVQRTWLWGERSQQIALILEFASTGQALGMHLKPGMRYATELVFYPGNYPLRALIKTPLSEPTPLKNTPGYPSINDFLDNYAQLLAHQFWMGEYLIPLTHSIPYYDNEKWYLGDQRGETIPISPDFNKGWQLLALSGGHPISVVGEWDGRQIFPLGAMVDDRFIPF